MPRYDFDCEEHGTFEIAMKTYPKKAMEEASCPICGKNCPRNWKTSVGSPPPPFHAYITEAFKGGPHYIKDKEHEKRMLGDEFVRLR